MAKSIVQERKECWVCRMLYGAENLRGLEKHHIYPGNPRRALSEKYGLTVWLCQEHHNKPPDGVHHNADLRRILQAHGQMAFEKKHPNKDFIAIFGKNYL